MPIVGASRHPALRNVASLIFGEHRSEVDFGQTRFSRRRPGLEPGPILGGPSIWRRRGQRPDLIRKAGGYGSRLKAGTTIFYSTPRRNLFDFGRPPARRPASARLPRQSASSFQLMLCSRPAESFQVSPLLDSKVATSDSFALVYFCRRTPRPRAISGT